MRFWIDLHAPETGADRSTSTCSRRQVSPSGERIVLAFVGGEPRTIEVTETPEQDPHERASRPAQSEGQSVTPGRMLACEPAISKFSDVAVWHIVVRGFAPPRKDGKALNSQ